LRYLVEQPAGRMPAILDLARELDISPNKLREQLEVARTLGLVEVRPKTGIRRLPYSFGAAIRASVRYALALDPAYFQQIGEVRNHIEVSFWHQAVRLLTADDRRHLQALVDRAWKKLRGSPVQIPHPEHRDLHLTIYSHIANEFVRGLLEAYWDAYETVGLAIYTDYAYLEMVWTYHQRIVEAIACNDYTSGYELLVEHAGLLYVRPEMDKLRPSPAERNNRKRSKVR
jgi:DNA-binding FadR family transcriptional regulator